MLGGSIVKSDKSDFDWSTPAEFLTSHLKTTLGNDWFENELARPVSERHIVVRWCTEGQFTIIDPENPVETCQFNGSALAYLHLAYDLFVLNDQHYLTGNLVKRLKVESSFNGARYEIFGLGHRFASV